jgi:hypothetical protein
MSKKKSEKSEKAKVVWARKSSFLTPCRSTLGQF